MRLHVSLRPATNVALMIVWLLIAYGVTLVSAGGAVALIAPAALVGLVAGAMQRAALRAAPDAFRAARSALEVRRALRGTVWGARYLTLFWGAQLLFVLVAVALGHEPLRAGDGGLFAFQMAWALASLYCGFALAREATSLTALAAL